MASPISTRDLALFRNFINQRLALRIGELYTSTYLKAEIMRRIEKGRKIRSFLCYNTAKALCPTLNDDTIVDVCLSIEMTHAASVLVDDILDGDDVRHGVESSHSVLGTPASVLQAHFLCAEALLIVSGMPSILKLLLTTYRKLTEGEMYDVFMPKPTQQWVRKGYGEFVYQKTSALFEYSFASAAIIARRKDAISPLQHLGHCLGRLYQFSNDYHDLQPTNLKKRHQSTDTWPVTFSLPLALYLERYGCQSLTRFLERETLSFDSWTMFLDTIWTTEVQALTKHSIKNSLSSVFSALEKTPLPENQKEDITSLAQLIDTECFWYHAYNEQ